MLCRKFELIRSNLDFLEIFKVAQKLGQGPCTMVFSQISSKMTRREFSDFIIFSDMYVCTYVV